VEKTGSSIRIDPGSTQNCRADDDDDDDTNKSLKKIKKKYVQKGVRRRDLSCIN
jgi:hypothetical protein